MLWTNSFVLLFFQEKIDSIEAMTINKEDFSLVYFRYNYINLDHNYKLAPQLISMHLLYNKFKSNNLL